MTEWKPEWNNSNVIGLLRKIPVIATSDDGQDGDWKMTKAKQLANHKQQS